MNEVPMFFLAAAFTDRVNAATRGEFETRAVLMATTIGLAIGALLFLVVYVRHRSRRLTQDRNRLRPASAAVSPKSTEASDDPERRRRRRKRRRRRDHRPRNPSLQQTGGLPPLRPDDQLPKY